MSYFALRLTGWVGHPLLKRSRSGDERLTPVDEAQEALEDIAQGWTFSSQVFASCAAARPGRSSS